jgi:O-methyltransferase
MRSTANPRMNRDASGSTADSGRYATRRRAVGAVESVLFRAYVLQAKHPVDRSRHKVTIPECTFAPWLVDAEFKSAYKRVSSHTLVPVYKLYSLWSCVRQTASVDGDILEVGVWRGGSGALLALAARSASGHPRATYLCDTFEGMPTTDRGKDNYYRGGELSDTSVDVVEGLLARCGITTATTVKGYFPPPPGAAYDDLRLSFAHIDVDIYPSARDAIRWIWDRLSPGGMVVFDDYGYSATEGVTRCVHEFMADRDDARFVYSGFGQGILVKTPNPSQRPGLGSPESVL